MRSKERGFTLIELMMVIAIIGILASIALPSYQTYVYRAKAAEVVVVLDKLHTVLSGFQAEKGIINQPYCINSVKNTPPTTGSALRYFGQTGGATPKLEQGEVSGMNQSELTVNSLGVDIHVSTCGTYANAPGQYTVIIKPLQASDTQARQVALAVQHVMQAQAYKSIATSTGSVLLYFQL